MQTVPRDAVAASRSESDPEEASNAMATKVDYFLPARPIGVLAPARYPAARIADGPESVTVAVILKISDRGDVSGIDLDPLAYSTPVKRIVDFVAALRAVASEWEFVPAAVMSAATDPGPDGATTLEKRPVASELAVQFTFSRAAIR
ncbi:MAG: hypothetical protein HYV96_08130 [Opitutae bacterium]|nr:hypothetical protein [Opitutae bacterium]